MTLALLHALTVLCDYGCTTWYNIIREKAESQVAQGPISLGLHYSAV